MANGLFVAEGVKVVSELIASPVKVEAIFSTDRSFLDGLSDDLRKETVTAVDMERMSSLSSASDVLAVARIPDVRDFPIETASLIVVLDGVRDPGNLGTILRTATWFGADRVVCSADCVDAWSPKVVQGAMGALFHRPPIYVDDLPEFLKGAEDAGLLTLAATLDGESINGFEAQSRIALVIGSESHGISDAVRQSCKQQVRISRYGEAHEVESLNAAIATAILLSEVKRSTV
jgi:RNA methyltransferase, TrmH family